MSRRSQSRRRRTYGRRQHEVRERRPDARDGTSLIGGPETELDTDWQAGDSIDERPSYGETFGGFSR